MEREIGKVWKVVIEVKENINLIIKIHFIVFFNLVYILIDNISLMDLPFKKLIRNLNLINFELKIISKFYLK